MFVFWLKIPDAENVGGIPLGLGASSSDGGSGSLADGLAEVRFGAALVPNRKIAAWFLTNVFYFQKKDIACAAKCVLMTTELIQLFWKTRL